MSSDTLDNQPIQYGGFWRRVFAFLIDLIIIKILELIMIGLGMSAAYQALKDLRLSAPSEDLVMLLTGLFILTGMLIFFLYFFYFNFQGQTPAKKLVGLKVISSSMEPLSLIQAFTRTFGLCFSFLTFGLGFLLMLFNKKKQTFHDFLAGTYVVRS